MHHAYVYEGSLTVFESLVSHAKERFGFADEHSPDVHARSFEKFGIEESRWLTTSAAFKSSGGRALFVVGTSSITSESQQALLKLFEEPQEGTVFVLLVPHGALLPTLRSRMLLYETQQPAQKKVLGFPVSAKTQEAGRPDHFSAQSAGFLRASGKERSDFIAKLLKDEEGLKERVRDFVNGLEAELTRLNLVKVAEGRRGLEDIRMVRDYLGDRSPSLKMLLEHLALSLPTV